ncbi:hypothetical protein LCGC14_0609100 [marine sediment metagenome]|uniref:Terminase large subunit gp17-like C-terminal domain-containing protein n=1 Tax=marine sediment metagenome TaxID=412755 RepID=A0A0F9RSI5_9ZZZZ
MLKAKNVKTYEGLTNSLRYIQRLLYIRNKTGIIRPFYLNRLQVLYYRLKQIAIKAGKKARFLVLKFRRGGITTFEQGLSFHLAATVHNQELVTLAHDKESTEKIFRISQLFYRKLPEEIQPERFTEHKQELNFPLLNSLFYIGTAGNKSFGRGQTIQRAHGSEVARWRGSNQDINDLIIGLTEAASHGEVVLETTPKGVGGWFHQTWEEAKKGGNDWTPIFLPWFLDPLNMIPLLPKEEMIANEGEQAFMAMVKRDWKMDIYAEQIKWRRDKQHGLKGLFPQEYPEDDVTAFLVTGINFFDVTKARDLVKRCKRPIEVRDGGHTVIWKRPEAGHRYVAGGDVGEGLPHSDYSGTGILDAVTCEQVACLHGRWKPEVYANKSVKLCEEYNRALFGIEANNHGHSALNTAKNTLHYTRLYYHSDYDQDGKVKSKLGYQTTVKTRPILLDDLSTALDDGHMIINDTGFLSECLTFQDNGSGKYEAMEGYHDDRIFMWGIAWQLRKQRFGAEPRVSMV